MYLCKKPLYLCKKPFFVYNPIICSIEDTWYDLLLNQSFEMLNCNVYICMSVLVVDLFKLLNLTLLLLFTIF